jgi:hypothetical protein
MTDRLWRLVYVSQASHDLTDPELVDLLEVSRRLNQRDRITGALAYHGQRFLQVLEGSETAVHDVFSRICRDLRNSDQIVILSAPLVERAFPNWSMGWIPAEEMTRAGFRLEILFSGRPALGVLDEIFIAFRKIEQMM